MAVYKFNVNKTKFKKLLANFNYDVPALKNCTLRKSSSGSFWFDFAGNTAYLTASLGRAILRVNSDEAIKIDFSILKEFDLVKE